MTLVKICGLREVAHAVVAAEAGADLLGFVFVHGVRRQLEVEQARSIIDEYRRLSAFPGGSASPGSPQLVGLFANQSLSEVNHVIARCGLDLAQLCGDEDVDYWRQVDADVIRQVRIDDTAPHSQAVEDALRRVEEASSAGCIPLLDKQEAGQLGGTGRTFDWSIAKKVAARFDVLLAGGLTPDNVRQAIEAVGPWGVDVSSGVETGGAKDPGKIVEFARAARGSDAPTAGQV